MSINKMDKIKETFTHIHNYWKEEEYKKCEFTNIAMTQKN
jgi:hypothetical protein